jgi:hypothetical protein
VLDAELRGLGLAKAKHQGLPPEWVARLAEWDPERRQVHSNLVLLFGLADCR